MANKYWIGAADDVAQVTTIAATGTWATGDTATITCNNKTVTVTIGSSVATTDVVAALAAAINAVDATAGLVNDETRNRGGQELGEFRDMVATSSASTLTLTSATAGVPFIVTASESTAGTGALGAVTEATAATGKNWFNNADNWASGSTPSIDDVIIFANSSIGVSYGLANTTNDLDIDRRNSFTGDIGLPAVNASHSGYSYPEYRQQKLDLPITATTGTQDGVIGEQNSAYIASGFTRIDFGTNAGSSQKLTVNDAAAASTSSGAAVVIGGGKSLVLDVYKGSLTSGNDNGTATEIGGMLISYSSVVATDATVWLGANVTIASSTTVTQTGGILYAYGFSIANMTYDLHAGTGYFDRGAVAIGSAPAVTVYAGATLYFDHIGATTVTLYGTLDLSQSSGSTFTNAVFYSGYNLQDPNGNGTWTNGIDFTGCQPSDGTLNVQDHQTWTPSAI